MNKIKTKEAVKGTVKALDKSAIAAERMKDAFVRTKDKAERGLYSDENSSSEYASDKITHATDRAVDEGVHQFNKQGQKGFEETRRNIGKAKEKIKTYKQQKTADTARQAANPPKEQMKRQAQSAHRSVSSARQGTNSTIKTANRSEKTIKYSAHSTEKAVKATEKGTIKTARKSVKTAEKTAKTTIKTTQQAARGAKAANTALQKTAQTSAKAAKVAAQTAKVTAKAAITTAKAVAKATIATVKAIIAATKALISAIVAGGWVAVIVIIVICLIGLIAGSCFGIFFSGEDSGTGQTMQTVIREINTDYDTRLEEIKTVNPHDVLEMSGSRAVWKEVLAVYSVKTTTDPGNPQEVATMDDSKKELLKAIFWEMNEISSRSESKTETVIEDTVLENLSLFSLSANKKQ